MTDINLKIELSVERGFLKASALVAKSFVDPLVAWYIYLDGARIAVSWYSKETSITHRLEGWGSYRVKCFLKVANDDAPVVIKNSAKVRYLGEVQTFDVDKIPEALSTGRYDFNVNNYIFETFYKQGEGGLVVFLNGAIADREKSSLPVFQRHTWAGDVKDHVICINDPTLRLDEEIKLGWYYGSLNRPLLPEMVSFLNSLFASLGVEFSEVVFYGSSGGGVASLMISPFFEGSRSVAVNPQTDVRRYNIKSAMDKFSEVSLNGEDVPEISVCEAWSRSSSYCFVYQNRLDPHHYFEHFLPFLESSGAVENGVNRGGNVSTSVFEDPRGHVAEPREAFKWAIEHVRSL